MKTRLNSPADADIAQRQPAAVAQREQRADGDEQREPGGVGASFADQLHASPRMVAQQKKASAIQPPTSPALQRQTPEEDGPLAQLTADVAPQEEDEPALAQRMTAQRAATTPEEEELPASSAVPVQAKADNDTGLPDPLKAGVESLSGMSLDDVKVHYNSDKPAQLNALAYAQGNDIHVGPGQEQHLPHETWHVVQQAQGRVQATTEVGGAAVNDDASLEREADTMGAQALAGH